MTRSILVHRVPFYETDAMGIVHHANYVRWLELARIVWMDEHDRPYREWMEQGFHFATTRVEVGYRRAAVFDDRVAVAVWLEWVAGASLAMVYEGNRHKMDNPQQFSRLDRNLLLEPADANGTASLGWRYKDPAKRDQLWAYVPALRRVRATSPSNRSDGVFGSEMTQDDGFNGFDAKPEDFTYKLVGQKDQYMSFAPEALDGKIQFTQYPDGQGWGVTSPEFVYGYKLPDFKGFAWCPVQSVLVPRPVWLLEATPKDRYYLYGKILIAIDRETYKVSNVVKYDWKGQPVGVFNRGISYGKAPDGYRFVNLTGGGQGGAYAENTKLERATAAEVMPKPVDNAIDIKLGLEEFQPDRLVQLGR